MASFFLTGNTTIGQSLTSGQNGYLTAAATIYTETTSAVIMSGATNLTVMGAVASSISGAVQLNNASSTAITIGAQGSLISEGSEAILGTFGARLDIINAGTVSGQEGIAVSSSTASGTFLLDNSGRIEGFGPTGSSAIAVAMASSGIATISNSGTIVSTDSLSSAINLVVGSNLNLTNTGTIEATLQGAVAINSAGSLSLHNSGDIIGNVQAIGSASIINRGVIDGAVFLSLANDTVINSGVIHGDVALGNGNNTYVSHGGIVDGTVKGGTGQDVYDVDQSGMRITDAGGLDEINTTVNFQMANGIEQMTLVGAKGLLATGSDTDNVIFGDVGNDTILGRGGADILIGGEGNNVLHGGAGDDALFGGADNDLMLGGDGNDILSVDFGDDTLSGGAGTDQLSLTGIQTDGNTVNLATAAVSFADAGKLTISGFEDAQGSNFVDTLIGSSGANQLEGRNGNDVLSGGGGNDTLIGDAGADTMNGGAGADTFAYSLVTDSAAAGGIDQITGFTLGADVIDLSQIDANAGSIGDDAFVFVGVAAFAGSGPQVRFAEDTVAGTTTIEVRLAGSVADDMVIQLNSALVLTAANFDL